jgi:hypothetical protein
MHSAIFVAEIPGKRGDWDEFLGIADVKAKEGKDVERISDNVWQINFREFPSALGWLIALCEQWDVRYRILPLADAPEWLPIRAAD